MKNENKSNLWIIVGITVIVALAVSIIATNITGNVIKLNQDRFGKYNVYTTAEVDAKINSINSQLQTKTSIQQVLDLIEDRGVAYDISLSDIGWDSNGDGYTSGEEVCNSQQSKKCLLALLEYDNGGTAGKGTEPLPCTSMQPVNIDETTIDILNVWCVSP